MKVNASKILIAIGVGATAINGLKMMVSAAYWAGFGEHMRLTEPNKGDELNNEVEACIKAFEERPSISNFEKLLCRRVLERAYRTCDIASLKKENNHE